jgi:hypothetical protein
MVYRPCKLCCRLLTRTQFTDHICSQTTALFDKLSVVASEWTQCFSYEAFWLWTFSLIRAALIPLPLTSNPPSQTSIFAFIPYTYLNMSEKPFSYSEYDEFDHILDTDATMSARDFNTSMAMQNQVDYLGKPGYVGRDGMS